MSNFKSGYFPVFMVKLALHALIEKHPALDGAHPLYDLFTGAIAGKIELLGHGVVWDFEDKIAYLWVKREEDARYIKDEWARFVDWLNSDMNVLPSRNFFQN